jgi:integrase
MDHAYHSENYNRKGRQKPRRQYALQSEVSRLSNLIYFQSPRRGEGERREARFFDAEQVRRIIAAPEPFATIYAVLACTGIRAGECLALKVTDSISTEQQLEFGARSTITLG